MKITVNVDCTPEEARRFFGLPDVSEMQAQMLEELQEKMTENIRNMDPETMMNTWLPASIQGFEQLQKSFWNQMGMAMGGTAQAEDAEKDDK